MTAWLTIVGIGEDGWQGLSAKARLSIQVAQHLIGSTRTLAMMPELKAQQHEWPQPFSAVIAQLKPLHGKATVMLATGDPMNFGAARKILSFIPKSEVNIITHFSTFSLSAAIMGWSLPDCDCCTIHGRPAANIEIFLQPNAKVFALTQDASCVAEVCRRLVARGFDNSDVTVLENLGGTRERVTTFKAHKVPDIEWSPLNSLAIHCKASPGAKIWSRVAGLPDEAFIHDGQMTKREVRSATIAALAPAPDEILWDVGAGCGSVGIEWMRSTRGTECYSVEPNAERRAMIATNTDQLGTPRLHIVEGKAPDALKALPTPHAIFIGGGIDDGGVFETCWQHLSDMGRLVANTVTLEGDAKLISLQKQYGGDLVRIDVSTLTHIGDMRALRPRMSVLQWRVAKS